MALEVTVPGKNDPRDPCAAATEAWMLVTLPRAVAFASSLLRDRAKAEDVVHDCYVRLLKKSDTYDLPRDGTKILFKAIANACVDRNHRDKTWPSLDAEGTSPPADPRAFEPRAMAEHRELESALADSLGALSPAQRGAIELKSLGYSLAEVAEALGTSPTNAGVLVHRARKALAEALAPFLEAPGND
jgi:RNA polymerase sigma-70 factor (ECF subfamily)